MPEGDLGGGLAVGEPLEDVGLELGLGVPAGVEEPAVGSRDDGSTLEGKRGNSTLSKANV